MRKSFPLCNWYWRYISIMGAVGSFFFFLFSTEGKDVNLAKALLFSFLYILCISKTKNETSCIQDIRNVSFKISFMIAGTVTLSVVIAEGITGADFDMPPLFTFKFLIVSFLVVFYIFKVSRVVKKKSKNQGETIKN
ncbi:MAG: hypothetical protein ACEPOW_08350 [Bacteroidales bacterium]